MVTTINRVQRNTDEAVNRRIEAATGERIRRLARHPLAIGRRYGARLRELGVLPAGHDGRGGTSKVSATPPLFAMVCAKETVTRRKAGPRAGI